MDPLSHVVIGADHQPAERRKRLRVPERLFALLGVWKQLGDPGDRGDEFDANPDEGR